jgi:predicted nucleotidyltransferase
MRNLDRAGANLYAADKTRVGEGPMDVPIREKPIVEEFKRRVERQFPGELIRLVVFGSRVRREATAESDLDILVVIRSDDWRRGDEIRALGYALEIEHGIVLSIQVMSLGHYEKLRDCGAQFLRAVEREGIVV